MKIKLRFYVLAAAFLVDFSVAKNEQKRRRPIIDATAQDSDGHYVDQIASDSISFTVGNAVPAPENYPVQYHAATNDFRKQKKIFSEPKRISSEPKVHYITPEPYKPSFSEDYVNHALKTNDKSKEKSAASSFLDYSSMTREEPKNVLAPKKKKIQNAEYEDYNYYFADSKRIVQKSTPKPLTVKYYKPQSPGAIITKDVKTNGGEMTNNYHYFYPEEQAGASPSAHITKLNQNNFDFPSSTFAPPTTKSPRQKFSSKRKTPVRLENTSTDSYQYQPVLQRPNEYTQTGNSQDFFKNYNSYDSKEFGVQSTAAPSTPSPVKMMKPTKKNNYYLPSSTMSPSTTGRPQKIRRPSTETPYDDLKQFSVSPSPASVSHYSTTRAPDAYKYSTPSPISSTTHGDFYIKPSSQVTPSATPSPVELAADSSDDRTVVIKPKTHYQSHESFDQSPVKETIIYKFVPEETYYEPNKTEFFFTQSSPAPYPETIESPDYYTTLNKSTQADMDFYNDFHKNYNYEYFTEQDAGPMQVDGTVKVDQRMESEPIDDRQRAEKKNMYFQMNSQMDDYMPSSMMPIHIGDRESPPPMEDVDNDAEASKNQYFVLYSVDDEEKERHKKNPKRKPKEPEVVYHRHHHEHDEKADDFQNFDSDFDSEFNSGATHSENVRIVDPAVRGGKPIEFTKDDYLRHIKQAVVQYMKDYQPKESSPSNGNVKLKNQRYHDSSLETPYRPTKAPAAATTASAYRQSLSPQQYKPMAPVKPPKNFYTADRLKDAIDELHESPQVDLTNKKSKQRPFDFSAIDVGQSYQHVSQFDHSSALKNVDEFDQSNIVSHQHSSRPKLQFSQQTYHDINNLSYNQKNKHQAEESDGESPNLYKGYVLPNKYSLKGNQGASSYSSMSYDGSKLPRITQGHDDDDDEENKAEDPVDAPIQIINGIPVANPYNIDLNTLKYMLGGIAQAEVNDQLKDFDDSPSSNQKFPSNWKSFAPNQLGSYTSNTPTYQVYGQQENGQRENGQRHKKNSGQTGNHGGNNNQQSKFPLVGSLVNFNKNKNSNNNNSKQKGQKSFAMSDFNGWNQMNKKQRLEPQASNSHFVLRPLLKNKQSRDEHLHQKNAINRVRQPQLSTDMRPPPQVKPPKVLRVKKVL